MRDCSHCLEDASEWEKETRKELADEWGLTPSEVEKRMLELGGFCDNCLCDCHVETEEEHSRLAVK